MPHSIPLTDTPVAAVGLALAHGALFAGMVLRESALAPRAAEPETPVQAPVATTRQLLVATPQTLEVRTMIQSARALDPPIEVLVRCPAGEEAALRRQEQAATVFVGEPEPARAMATRVLAHAPR